MSIHTPARKPAGCPDGGQFAPAGQEESSLDLHIPAGTPANRGLCSRADGRGPGLMQIDPGVAVPEEVRERFDQVAEGIRQTAAKSGVPWRVTEVFGNSTHVVVHAEEQGLPGSFRIDADEEIIAMTTADGAAASTLLPFLARPTSERVAGSLPGVVATIRAQTSLRYEMDQLDSLPRDVASESDYDGLVHTLTRADGSQLQLEADKEGVHAATRFPHPITGETVIDVYTVRVDGKGSMRAWLEETREGLTPAPDRTGKLADWIDQMSGEQGLLWRAAYNIKTIQDRYLASR